MDAVEALLRQAILSEFVTGSARGITWPPSPIPTIGIDLHQTARDVTSNTTSIDEINGVNMTRSGIACTRVGELRMSWERLETRRRTGML
jgi:hypothetical protein